MHGSVRQSRWGWIRTAVVLGCGLWFGGAAEAKTDPDIDEHIRRIVGDMMHQKDSEIAGLKARVQQLETQLRQLPKTPAAREAAAQPPGPSGESPPQEPPSMAAQPAKAETPDTAASKPARDEREMRTMKREVEKLKKAEEERLKLHGFFDMSAKTENPSGKIFDFGSIELDIEFQYLEHFAGSAALVWDGDTAEAAVAMVDYHQFDHRTPPRGRIFVEPGFHVQAGKFDIPYALDYQYFAARDRLTITPPLTTETIQQGGYNSEGVRSYGRWENVDYSVFWTNPVYGDRGTTLGGRLGGNFGHFPFHMSGIMPDLVGAGFSFLADLDGKGNARDYVYGADFSFNYEPFHIWSEALWRDARQAIVTGDGTDLGRPSESAYHVTAVMNLAQWLKRPFYVFGRYGNWHPEYSALVADDGLVYDVQPVDLLTMGFGWVLNDYVKIRMEYDDSLGSGPNGPLFVKRIGMAQLVVAF